MNDMNSNEGQLPEDAAVTVTNADTLRAMASPIRMSILGTLRVHGEQTVSHQLPLGAACACGTSEKGGVS